MVYLEKYEAHFSRNLEEVKETIWDRMCVKIMMAHLRYLGLPTVFVRYKKDIFVQMIDRIWKKVKGWKDKFLSRAGKEVMIKSVAQVIPTYVMSCFRLPEDYGFKILGQDRGLRQEALACELVDQDLCCWKRDLIGSCFDPNVCSQTKDVEEDLGGPIHNRIQNFVWYLKKNFLLTRENLMKKGIKCSPECPLCQNINETIRHFVWIVPSPKWYGYLPTWIEFVSLY
ncbi:hypothetical protein KIW84_025417 [Lathyrus oleraceus]|uniref:Reverse transcriptase zinc-binding domain-containing protein n=1 Tax=Pisum sativum TaxID=3888 RepID=A0A9D4YLS9_PEA|nr:hypothetical protein KIW84_025417 [Pisum sativum]